MLAFLFLSYETSQVLKKNLNAEIIITVIRKLAKLVAPHIPMLVPKLPSPMPSLAVHQACLQPPHLALSIAMLLLMLLLPLLLLLLLSMHMVATAAICTYGGAQLGFSCKFVSLRLLWCGGREDNEFGMQQLLLQWR